MSISQHAASAQGAQWLFAGTLIIGGSVFYYWLLGWFTPRLHLTTLFVVLLSITIFAQVITAIIPDTDKWKRMVHRVAAYGMAVLYFPLAILILLNTASVSAKVAESISLLYMVIAFVLFVFLAKAKERYLIFQSLYVIAFQVIILAAAYL